MPGSILNMFERHDVLLSRLYFRFFAKNLSMPPTSANFARIFCINRKNNRQKAALLHCLQAGSDEE